MAKDKLQIEQLASECLVNLLDKDYQLIVRPMTGYYMIKLLNPYYFDWSEIKEDYLFFIQIMINDYKLVGRFPFTINTQYNSAMNLTLEMVLNYDGEYGNLVKSITVFLA